MINDASKIKFDQKPNAYGLSFEDLDQAALESFTTWAKAAKKIQSVDSMTSLQILKRIGAIVLDNPKVVK